MRHAFARQQTAAGEEDSPWRLLARCWDVRESSPALAVAAAALALSGCMPIPVPDAALLAPQPVPRCEGKARQQPAAAPEAGVDTAAVAKLDYERQCYRHAELIARNRLNKLQASVQETVKAIKRNEGETR
jgi:hypothetical protein